MTTSCSSLPDLRRVYWRQVCVYLSPPCSSTVFSCFLPAGLFAERGVCLLRYVCACVHVCMYVCACVHEFLHSFSPVGRSLVGSGESCDITVRYKPLTNGLRSLERFSIITTGGNTVTVSCVGTARGPLGAWP